MRATVKNLLQTVGSLSYIKTNNNGFDLLSDDMLSALDRLNGQDDDYEDNVGQNSEINRAILLDEESKDGARIVSV